jgi:hypothetical protein
MQSIFTRTHVICLFFLALISQTTSAQEPAAWDEDAATKEIDGMRRYAWVVSDGIGKTLEKSPADKFPAVHAFMRDFREARKGIDSDGPPSKWKIIDVETLATRNSNYWSAVYEVAPADPLMMWFHATLYAVNGQVHRTFYSQQLAMHSPIDTPWKKEMPRLMVSAGRLITIGNAAVQNGTKLHDQEQYDEAAKVYRDVLSVVPSHSLALYELGYTLRTSTKGEGGRGQQVEEPFFDKAKRFDPFMMSAYQGSFRADEFKQIQALRTKAKPSWDEFSQTPPARDDVKQLDLLSSHLQAAGLHDLALIARQLAVAHRENSFNDDDRRFIETSLKSLVPKGDFDATLKRLSSEREELHINNLTTSE